MSPDTKPKDIKPSARPKKYRLSFGELLSGAMANQVQQISQIVRTLPATVGTLSKAARHAASRSRLLSGKAGVSNLTLAPRTRLNTTVSAERAFAGVSVPLNELKALGRLHQATLNDMVLMLCATALRRHFAKHGALPRKSMIAAVPVSLRAAGDATADNQASVTAVSLGTHIGDPMKRLQHIKAATAAMKETLGTVKSILPTDFPSIGLPWIMEAATKLYGRTKLADRIPQLANVAISNVPGPNVPLYMAGARMVANYPTSVVVHGLALNITVQSYNESLDFGLMADAKALPDVRDLAAAIAVAFDDLRALSAHDADGSSAGRELVKSAGRVLTRALDTAATTAARSAGKLVASQLRAMRR